MANIAILFRFIFVDLDLIRMFVCKLCIQDRNLHTEWTIQKTA